MHAASIAILATLICLPCPTARADWDWNAYVDGDPEFDVSSANHAYWEVQPPGFRITHDDMGMSTVAAWKSVGSFSGPFAAWVEFDNFDTGESLGVYLAEDGFNYMNPDAGDTDYVMTSFGTTLLRGNTLGWGSKNDDSASYAETYSTGHPSDGDRYAVMFGRTADSMLFADFFHYFEGKGGWELVLEQEWTESNPDDALTDLYLVSNVWEPVRFTSADYKFTKIVVTPEPTSLALLALGSLAVLRRR
jgi:hypothetical protein